MTNPARVPISRAGTGLCRMVGGQQGVLQTLACQPVEASISSSPTACPSVAGAPKPS